MTKENTTRKPRRVLRAIGKVLAYGGVLAVAALIVAHFVWKYSGSGEWELMRDRKGVQVYTRKTPGSVLKDIKCVRRVKTTLSGAVAAMTSTKTEDCAAWHPGCVAEKTIQPWNPQQLTYLQLYSSKYPSPMAPREFLIGAKVTQNPQTKAVLVDFQAQPEAIPANDCCVRISVLHNTWQFTPLDDGEVKVELTMHTDPELPYFIYNRFAPFGIYGFFNRGLQKYLHKPEFQQAKFESIAEK